MTKFYLWLTSYAQLNAEGDVGVAARWVRDNEERFPILRQSENISAIGSDLFSRHVPRVLRMKIRAAHRAWRRSLLVAKYGEWPISGTAKRRGRGQL